MYQVRQLTIIYNYVIKNICPSVMFPASSSLETRKQNYIIIITSLLGSFMLFRFLQKIFSTNCWKLCWKTVETVENKIVNLIYTNSKHNLHIISPIQTHQKYLNIIMQIDYTIPHIPYHNILYHTPKNPTKTTTNCTA